MNQISFLIAFCAKEVSKKKIIPTFSPEEFKLCGVISRLFKTGFASADFMTSNAERQLPTPRFFTT
jgi:hypothetical protein